MLGLAFLLAGCAAEPVPDRAAGAWDPTLDDGLGDGPSGLGVQYTHTDEPGKVPAYTGNGRAVDYEHHDASERVDHVSGSEYYRYDEQYTWVSDECATTERSFQQDGSTVSRTESTVTCLEGWPVRREAHAWGVHEGEEWERDSLALWAYTWESPLVVTIRSSSGDDATHQELSTEERRTYDDAGRLVISETTADSGAWGVTEYTWGEHGLLSLTYTNAFGENRTTWSYDEQRRVSGWETDSSSGSYLYIQGTRRVGAELLDRDQDGEHDLFVGYTWSEGDEPSAF